MTPLNKTQLAVLHDAFASDGGLSADAVDGRVARALIKRALLIAIPRDGEPSLLAITREGRAAAGLGAEVTGTPVSGAGGEPPQVQPMQSKTALMRDLLGRADGATVAQMAEATGWLPHSVRGFMAGALKKKHGLAIASEKTAAGRVYRITDAAR